MKIKIDVEKLTYTPDGEEPIYPLPIGVNWEGEVEVFGRLLRLRGETDWRFKNADFELSKINSPWIHLQGAGCVETHCDTIFVEEKTQPTLQILHLKVYKGRNILLHINFIGEIKDLSKRADRERFVLSMHERIKHRPPEICQGHLKGYYLLTRVEMPDFSFAGKMAKLLNHEFFCEKPFRWVEYDYSYNYSMVICCPKGESLYVVSPDHLESPFSLSLISGCYYFTHPEPNDED